MAEEAYRMNDERNDSEALALTQILNVIVRFALGDLTARGTLADDDSTLDGVMAGINSLGEELQATVAEHKRALEYANTLINSSPDGIIAVDIGLRVTEWNRLIENMSGMNREQAMGQSLADIPFIQETGEAARTSQSLRDETYAGIREIAFRVPGTDKESVFESIIAPLPGSEGQIIGGVLRIRDITDRKTSQQALLDSEALLRGVFNAMQDGIMVAEARTGQHRMANNAMCRMLGYSREEFLTTSVENDHPKKDLPSVARNFERAARRKHNLVTDVPMERKDGTVFHVDITSGPTTIDGVACLVGAFRDITDRKGAEEEILNLNKALQERVEQLTQTQDELVRKEKLATLGQVAGSVGHELRNPLGVMSNAVYYLQAVLTDADETTKEYLGILNDEIANADRIVGDLLDSVRTKPPLPGVVDVKALLEQTLGKCDIPDNVILRLEIPETLAPLLIDAQHIQQVFRNLIGNAAEAMPTGGTLDIAAVEHESQGTTTISVSDTGIGITPEGMARLFQPLFTTKSRGIGLGLMVVKNLTEANGGRVEVQNELGKGATFSVTLPRHSVGNEQGQERAHV